jgi:uncharacterized protein DUF6496
MARKAKKKRRYSKSSGSDVKSEMRRYKKGKAKSGKGGKGGKVKSRKQAIAIGLSKARKKREKGPEEEVTDSYGPDIVRTRDLDDAISSLWMRYC